MSRSAIFLAAAAAVVLIGIGGVLAVLGEPAVGTLTITVVAEDTGSPLPDATVWLTRPQQPGQERPSSTYTADDEGRVTARNVPTGTWQVESWSAAHRLRTTLAVTVAEGQRQQVVLELPPVEPFLTSLRSQRTYRGTEQPWLVVRGFSPDSTLQVTLYRVQVEGFANDAGRFSALLYGYADERETGLAADRRLTRVDQFTVPVGRRDTEGVFHQRVRLPRVGPGTYLATAECSGKLVAGLYSVTDLALVVKLAGRQVVAYTADLGTGQPVPGTPVRLIGGEGKTIGATSDAQGLARFTLPAGTVGQVFLIARRGTEEAFVRMYSGRQGEDLLTWTCTDRPVYRPGDRVYLKGVARRRLAAGYEAPAGVPVALRVSDPNGDPVLARQVTTNRFGSYAADLALWPEALTGSYQVTAQYPQGEEVASWFTVASYRKPEFSLSVRPARERCILGEQMRVEIDSRYFFGSPVAGAKVTCAVYRSPFYFYPGGQEEGLSPAYEQYGYGDYDEWGYGGGEQVEELTAVTGQDGRAAVTVRTQPEDAAEPVAEYDYEYRVSATLTEASRAEVTADATFLATRGDFAVYVEPASYLAAPGQPVPLRLQAVDYDGRPVPGVRLLLAAGTERWRGEEEPVRRVRWHGEARTGADGRAEVTLKPAVAGSWYIEATARDRAGRPLLARSSLWVTRENADLGNRPAALQLTLDHRSYQVGDTARVVVGTRHPGVTALLSVEGLRLVSCRVVRLPAGTTVLEVPVTAECRPNATVNVSYVYKGEFVEGQAPLVVDTQGSHLRVALAADRRSYEPGQTATIRVTTTTEQGRPAPAELAVGIVDEAIYGVREDDTPNPYSFFWGRTPNRVETAYSFSEIFLGDGDKEGSATLRRRFPDTAYWNPSLVTGPDGQAVIRLAVPDSLTTWRITARGGDTNSRFGEARSSLLVTRPLLVRLVAPPVLRFGDRPLLSGIVHNRSDRELEVSTDLRLSGVRITAGRPQQRFRLAAGQMQRIEWPAVVYRTGLARLQFTARAGSLADGIELRPPLLHTGRVTAAYRAGSATVEPAREVVYLRRDAVPSGSTLTVRLSPSLAGPLLTALRYLATYPYGCTEQTMSAFLPDVLLAQAAPGLQQAARLPDTLPNMVQAGLLKLYSLRHDDGGWGWWTYDENHPWMTAYVLFGLATARQAGYRVNDRYLDQAAEWLQQRIRRQPILPPAEQALTLLALARASKLGSAETHLANMSADRYGLPPAALACLSLAWQETGDREAAGNLAGQLWQQVSDEGGGLHWAGSGSNFDALDSTALALAAVERATPDDPRLPEVVRWMMQRRTGDCWQSTRQTAWTLFALIPFVERELEPDFTAVVAVDGQRVAREHFGPADVGGPDRVVTVRAADLREGANTITISKAGQGRVYYALALRQLLRPQTGTVLTGGGLQISRQYYGVRTGPDPRTGLSLPRAEPRPRRSFRSGEAVMVRLTVRSRAGLPYALIEDPYPPGMQPADRGEVDPWAWEYWWSAIDYRDDRVNVPARWVPAGEHRVEYMLRAVIPGSYTIPPTVIYNMYEPQRQAVGAADRVEVRP